MYVLVPHNPLSIEILFYVSSIIEKEGWRFNYSRKVTKAKLEDLDIPLPINNEAVDDDYINQVAKNSYG
jgi:hypothetical protein